MNKHDKQVKKLKAIIESKGTKFMILVDQGIVSGSNFILSILIARYLGIYQFGIFGFISLVYLFFLGLQQSFFVIPMYSLGASYQEENRRNYLNALFFLQVFFATGFAILACLFFSFVNLQVGKELQELSVLIGVTALLVLLQDFQRRLFIYEGKYRSLLIVDTLAYFSQIVILSILHIAIGLSLKICLWVVCLSMLMSIVYGTITLKNISFDISTISLVCKRHWKYARWLLARSVLNYSSGNFFIIAAGAILGPVAIGAIKMGQNLHGAMNVIFLAIENHVPIVAAKVFNDEGRTSLFSYLRRVTLKTILVSCALGALVLVFSNWLIFNLYGEEYLAYAYLLIWFAVLNVLICISMPFRFALRTFENTKALFIATAVSALFGFLFAYSFIENYQVNGVIAGLMISQMISIGILGLATFYSRYGNEHTIKRIGGLTGGSSFFRLLIGK
jgi:O-antigen/teichoic acid export membrane protein